jgi:DNA polymerase-3 subunit delta
MSIYVYWGEDDFAMNQAVQQLRDQVLTADWVAFNYEKITADSADAVINGLNQAMTPPFGMGERLVWLSDTTICQSCSDRLLEELQRTLPNLPDNSHLLLTTPKKPDGRSKVTKLLKKHGTIQEFALIPPWKTDELLNRVRQITQAVEVKLSPDAITLLAESIGNDTRRLWSELEKLKLYAATTGKPLDAEIVSRLVVVNTQSSFQLAHAIREGNTAEALGLVTDLINRNEPALRIVATLVGQFRTWTVVKLMIESGQKDENTIAKAAEVGNPKRIYFIRKEVQSISTQKLLQTLPLLLELEFSLKRGADPLMTLQTKVVELCQEVRRGKQ